MSDGHNFEASGHGFSPAVRRRAAARHISRCLTRAKSSIFLPFHFLATRHSRSSTRDTGRVETRVTLRNQRAGHIATRDCPRRTDCRRSGVDCRRFPKSPGAIRQAPAFTSHQSPVTNHVLLIGTPRRLETRVSRRKQSTGCTSNRYGSPSPILRLSSPLTTHHLPLTPRSGIFFTTRIWGARVER